MSGLSPALSDFILGSLRHQVKSTKPTSRLKFRALPYRYCYAVSPRCRIPAADFGQVLYSFIVRQKHKLSLSKARPYVRTHRISRCTIALRRAHRGLSSRSRRMRSADTRPSSLGACRLSRLLICLCYDTCSGCSCIGTRDVSHPPRRVRIAGPRNIDVRLWTWPGPFSFVRNRNLFSFLIDASKELPLTNDCASPVARSDLTTDNGYSAATPAQSAFRSHVQTAVRHSWKLGGASVAGHLHSYGLCTASMISQHTGALEMSQNITQRKLSQVHIRRDKHRIPSAILMSPTHKTKSTCVHGGEGDTPRVGQAEVCVRGIGMLSSIDR